MPRPLARCTCLPYLHINQVKSNWLTNNLRISIRILYKYRSPPLFPLIHVFNIFDLRSSRYDWKPRREQSADSVIHLIAGSSLWGAAASPFFDFFFYRLIHLCKLQSKNIIWYLFVLVLIVEIETSLHNLVARVCTFPRKKIRNRWSFRRQSINRQWEKKDLSLASDFQGIRIRMKAVSATNERKWSESNLHISPRCVPSSMTCLMTPVRLPKLSRIVNVIRKALFAFNAAKASMKNAAEKQKPKTEDTK